MTTNKRSHRNNVFLDQIFVLGKLFNTQPFARPVVPHSFDSLTPPFASLRQVIWFQKSALQLASIELKLFWTSATPSKWSGQPQEYRRSQVSRHPFKVASFGGRRNRLIHVRVRV
ncbi:hypothetical protein ACGC1H_001469 [Rhizoctonia solani]